MTEISLDLNPNKSTKNIRQNRLRNPRSHESAIVCIAKAVRTIGFGAVPVVLALFLIDNGFSAAEVGALFSLTLLEDAFITTLASVFANRLGMRKVLLLASFVILVGGFALAFAQVKWVLALAVIFGIVSPAGFEGGPFAPIEQAIISQSGQNGKTYFCIFLVQPGWIWRSRTGRAPCRWLRGMMKGQPPVAAYQCIFIFNAISSFVLAILYLSMDMQNLR